MAAGWRRRDPTFDFPGRPAALASYLVYLARHAGAGYGPTFDLIRAQGAAAIGAWTIVMIVAVAAGRRMAAAGRRTTAWVVTGLGALLATDVAAFLASVRAAGTLHIGRGSGLLWFPLSYLPDGFSGIGPLIPAGTTRIGNGSIGSDQAFPALNLLLPTMRRGRRTAVDGSRRLSSCSRFAIDRSRRPCPTGGVTIDAA